MLLQMALADSYSIAFEFVEDSADRPNTLTEFYQHPKYKDMKPGCYTDDTQRALANALMVLEYGKYQNNRTHAALFNPIAYVTAYQNIFRQDPRPGYSRRFEAFLKENLDTPYMKAAAETLGHTGEETVVRSACRNRTWLERRRREPFGPFVQPWPAAHSRSRCSASMTRQDRPPPQACRKPPERPRMTSSSYRLLAYTCVCGSYRLEPGLPEWHPSLIPICSCFTVRLSPNSLSNGVELEL